MRIQMRWLTVGLLMVLSTAGAVRSAEQERRLSVLPFVVRNVDPALGQAFAARLSEALDSTWRGAVSGVAQTEGALAADGVGPSARTSADMARLIELGKRRCRRAE